MEILVHSFHVRKLVVGSKNGRFKVVSLVAELDLKPNLST